MNISLKRRKGDERPTSLNWISDLVFLQLLQTYKFKKLKHNFKQNCKYELCLWWSAFIKCKILSSGFLHCSSLTLLQDTSYIQREGGCSMGLKKSNLWKSPLWKYQAHWVWTIAKLFFSSICNLFWQIGSCRFKYLPIY